MKSHKDVMIASGMHQFQHGEIMKVDNATVIPFAHVRLRNKNGELSKVRGAYVPLKYCVEIGRDCAASVSRARREARKARRLLLKNAAIEPGPALANAKPLDWEK